MEITVDTVVDIIAHSLESNEPGYKKAIKSSIELLWAKITEVYRFDIMRSVTPKKLTITADSMDVEAAGKNIQHPMSIVNENWKILYYYRNFRYFQKFVGDVDSSITTPVIFTLKGKASGKHYFLLYPKPGSSSTAYLDYLEAGSLANFNKCPAAIAKALIHGVKSIISPPKLMNVKGGRRIWETIQSVELGMFKQELDEALALVETVPEPDNIGKPTSNWMFNEIGSINQS